MEFGLNSRTAAAGARLDVCGERSTLRKVRHARANRTYYRAKRRQSKTTETITIRATILKRTRCCNVFLCAGDTEVDTPAKKRGQDVPPTTGDNQRTTLMSEDN